MTKEEQKAANLIRAYEHGERVPAQELYLALRDLTNKEKHRKLKLKRILLDFDGNHTCTPNQGLPETISLIENLYNA